MSEPISFPEVADFFDPPAVRRLWVDVLLVAVGVVCLGRGWWLPAAGALGLGLVSPLAHRSRGGRVAAALSLVPGELVAAYQEVLAASRLPGVDGTRVAEAAADGVVEVAVMLGGRVPRGAAQLRFVAAHASAMTDAAAEVRQWSGAWIVAKAEVDTIAAVGPVAVRPQVDQERGGSLVTALTVVLAPFFIGWDAMCLTARGFVSLRDGLALRARLTARVVLRVARGLRGVGARARHTWSIGRARVAASLAEARHRFLATRLRVRLTLRRVRRRRFRAAGRHAGPGVGTAGAPENPR